MDLDSVEEKWHVRDDAVQIVSRSVIGSGDGGGHAPPSRIGSDDAIFDSCPEAFSSCQIMHIFAISACALMVCRTGMICILGFVRFDAAKHVE